MKVRAWLWGWVSVFVTANCCVAGSVVLPSDVAVGLTANPSSALEAGQRITFNISVKNNGSVPVDRVVLTSSPIYDELDTTTASAECEGNLVLAVVDLGSSFYYLYTWSAATSTTPLAAGETRVCTLNIDYTPMAPAIFPVTFGFPNWLSDPNPANNAASVSLLKAVATPAPVPTLAGWWQLVMALALLAGAKNWRIRKWSL